MRTRLTHLLVTLVLIVGLLAPAAAAQSTDVGALVFVEAYRVLRDEALARPPVETLLQGADAGLRQFLREEGQAPASLGALTLTGDERTDVDQVLHRIEATRALSRRPAQAAHAAIAGMVAALRDPNSAFYTPEAFAQFNRRIGREEFVGIGIVIEDRAGQPVITDVLENSPAGEAGVRGGDVILAVDGVPTAGRSLEEVSQMIRGAEGTTVTLRLQRNGQVEPVTLTIERRRISPRVVTTRILGSGVGYLRLAQFTQGSDALVAEGLRALLEQGARGIVLDMRGNPGGLLEAAVNIASHFLEAGVVVTLESGRGQSTAYVVRPRAPRYTGPLVVLVDRGSASASEVVAGALQDAGVKLIGTRTYGKATVQAVYRLRDGSGMRVTVSRYVTPAGRDIEGRGLPPDIEVSFTGPIGSPDDAPLNRAVAMLTQTAQALPSTGTP
ncbi:MAG: S41 family peptidase [Armatimonadota bacterium]|nr:S41 family peptidase [Armatimonadota bacterium]MDR7453890.1 S41 family peptidase [Armatimonadota bacterium]MDR7495718.1 S41 family peptidase [Armatimonadota bacterium]MDR7513153.1 S41 family peptidase [Armatimonadota bacterium]